MPKEPPRFRVDYSYGLRRFGKKTVLLSAGRERQAPHRRQPLGYELSSYPLGRPTRRPSRHEFRMLPLIPTPRDKRCRRY